MPPNSATGPQRKVFKFLAAPGMYLVYKYTQYRRQQQESAKKKATEKELQSLNQKIDKLLTKIDNNDSPSPAAHCQEEECVVCLCARATMQTFPCGHKVVCRKCFVRTIQIAVNQRCLPLRCVVCRTKILKLKQTRDASPLTPPPSRNHIKLPWQRERSISPSVRRTRNNPSSACAQRSASAKPFATRAMQSLLIYPEHASQPKQAFMPNSVLKKDDESQTRIKTLRKQVRFSLPATHDSPAQGDDEKLTSMMHTSKTPHMSVGARAPLSSFDSLECDNIQLNESLAQRTILRNTAEMRIPAICDYDCIYKDPCLAKLRGPQHNLALLSSPKRVHGDI